MWEPQPPGNLRACPGIDLPLNPCDYNDLPRGFLFEVPVT